MAVNVALFFLLNIFGIDILQTILASIYFLWRHKRKNSNSPGTIKNHALCNRHNI